MRNIYLLSIFLITAVSFGQSPKKENSDKAANEVKMFKDQKETAASPSSLILSNAVIALNVNNLEPENISDTFPSEVHRLFCFTQIKGANGPTEVQHRWYWKDELMGTVSLQINSGNFRTYSSKFIPKGLNGDWRVSIIDSRDESILGTVKFITQ